MNYYIDQKFFEILAGDQLKGKDRYENYQGQLAALQIAFMSAYLKQKGISEESVDKYMSASMNQLEQLADLAEAKPQSQIKAADLEAIDLDLPQQEIELINNHLTQPHYQEQLEAMVNGLNATFYEEARENLPQAQKDELNAYISGVEAERQNLAKYLTEQLERPEVKEAIADLEAEQQSANQESSAEPNAQPPVETTSTPLAVSAIEGEQANQPVMELEGEASSASADQPNAVLSDNSALSAQPQAQSQTQTQLYSQTQAPVAEMSGVLGGDVDVQNPPQLQQQADAGVQTLPRQEMHSNTAQPQAQSSQTESAPAAQPVAEPTQPQTQPTQQTQGNPGIHTPIASYPE